MSEGLSPKPGVTSPQGLQTCPGQPAPAPPSSGFAIGASLAAWRSTCLRGFDGGNVRPARASRWTGPAGTGGLSSEPERLVGNGSPWFGERRPRTDRNRSTPGDTRIGVIMLLHLRQADTRAIAGWPQRIIMKATPPANVRDRVGAACENKTRAAQRHAPRHISVSTAYRRRKWCPEEDSNLHDLAIAST